MRFNLAITMKFDIKNLMKSLFNNSNTIEQYQFKYNSNNCVNKVQINYNGIIDIFFI